MVGELVKVEYQQRVWNQAKKGEAGAEFLDMVEKLQGMTLQQVMADKGLAFEKVLSRPKEKLWTLRINKNWRAICRLNTGPVIEIIAAADHTKTHSIRR